MGGTGGGGGGGGGGHHVGLEGVCVSRGVPGKGPGAETSHGGPRSPMKGGGGLRAGGRAHWRGCGEVLAPLGSPRGCKAWEKSRGKDEGRGGLKSEGEGRESGI